MSLTTHSFVINIVMLDWFGEMYMKLHFSISQVWNLAGSHNLASLFLFKA